MRYDGDKEDSSAEYRPESLKQELDFLLTIASGATSKASTWQALDLVFKHYSSFTSILAITDQLHTFISRKLGCSDRRDRIMSG